MTLVNPTVHHQHHPYTDDHSKQVISSVANKDRMSTDSVQQLQSEELQMLNELQSFSDVIQMNLAASG